MQGGPATESGLGLTALKRADALAALQRGPQRRTDLMDELGVSRTTIHRTVRALEADGLAAQDGDVFALTAFGRAVAGAVTDYRERVRGAARLRPLLEAVEGDLDVDLALLVDATVTTMDPTNPYGPVARFMELLRTSDSLRGFDTTAIAPVFVDEIRDQILGGTTTDVVYLPGVVDDIATTYPDQVATAIDSGELALSTHPGLPFGLAVFDDRVGIGGYDDESGLLRAFVDTDDPAVREWALAEYERYRDEATPFDPDS